MEIIRSLYLISPCTTLIHRYQILYHQLPLLMFLCDLHVPLGHLLLTKEVLLCCVFFSVRYLAKLSSVGSIRDEETCERLRGLIQRQVHTSTY